MIGTSFAKVGKKKRGEVIKTDEFMPGTPPETKKRKTATDRIEKVIRPGKKGGKNNAKGNWGSQDCTGDVLIGSTRRGEKKKPRR